MKRHLYLLEALLFMVFDTWLMLYHPVMDIFFCGFCLLTMTDGIFNTMKDFESFMVNYMKWLVWPFVLLLAMVFVFIERKKLRWLKNKWPLVSIVITWKYMCNINQK